MKMNSPLQSVDVWQIAVEDCEMNKWMSKIVEHLSGSPVVRDFKSNMLSLPFRNRTVSGVVISMQEFNGKIIPAFRLRDENKLEGNMNIYPIFDNKSIKRRNRVVKRPFFIGVGNSLPMLCVSRDEIGRRINLNDDPVDNLADGDVFMVTVNENLSEYNIYLRLEDFLERWHKHEHRFRITKRSL